MPETPPPAESVPETDSLTPQDPEKLRAALHTFLLALRQDRYLPDTAEPEPPTLRIVD